MEKGNKSSKCGNKCFGYSYDILAQVISILDVVTDIIVCVQYYQKDRMVFFWISFIILMLALIAYDVAFMINFCDEDKISRKIALFLVMLPLSPFVPFLFYFTTDKKSKFSLIFKNICCFDIWIDNRSSVSNDVSKLRQFMEKKIKKHLGFIVEALVEGIYHIHLPFHPCTKYHVPSNINSISSSNSTNGSNCHL